MWMEIDLVNGKQLMLIGVTFGIYAMSIGIFMAITGFYNTPIILSVFMVGTASMLLLSFGKREWEKQKNEI